MEITSPFSHHQPGADSTLDDQGRRPVGFRGTPQDRFNGMPKGERSNASYLVLDGASAHEPYTDITTPRT